LVRRAHPLVVSSHINTTIIPSSRALFRLTILQFTIPFIMRLIFLLFLVVVPRISAPVTKIVIVFGVRLLLFKLSTGGVIVVLRGIVASRVVGFLAACILQQNQSRNNNGDKGTKNVSK